MKSNMEKRQDHKGDHRREKLIYVTLLLGAKLRYTSSIIIILVLSTASNSWKYLSLPRSETQKSRYKARCHDYACPCDKNQVGQFSQFHQSDRSDANAGASKTCYPTFKTLYPGHHVNLSPNNLTFRHETATEM